MVLGITTAKAYRQKVESDLVELKEDISNSRLAINAVTSVYHLHEWLWSKAIKHKQNKILFDANSNLTIQLRKKNDLKKWLDENCPHFKLIQSLTNGSKHTTPTNVHDENVSGFGVGPYGIGPFGAPYLLVDLGPEASRRYLVASDVISEAGEFMVQLAKANSS